MACKNEKKTEEVEDIQTVEAPKPEVKKLEVHINPASDSGMVGHATFVEKEGKVSLTAMFEGLTPGEHAIHLHDVADCSSGDGKSAGGHWNPTGVDHGKWMEGQAHHAGDIGNFTADAEGKASLTFETDNGALDVMTQPKTSSVAESSFMQTPMILLLSLPEMPVPALVVEKLNKKIKFILKPL